MKIAHKANGQIQTKEEQKLYDILNKLPQPKKEFNLSREQRIWWYWFGREFIQTNEFSPLDLPHLQKAAFWMDARCQAYEKINELGYKGLVQTFESRATNITGHLTLVEKADKHLDDVSSHFGLSIRDRQKLKKATDPNPNQLSFLAALEMLDKKIAQ